jgi:hypothetical protein
VKEKTMDKEKMDRLEHEAEGGAAGAIAGAVVGAVAGPPGAIVGAVLGAAAGALAGLAADKGNVAREAEDAALDGEIGVSGGELGAPNLKHPPATTGAYSGASSGAAAGGEETSAEGPIPVPAP